MPEYCSNCTDMQARIDFVATYLGDRPITNWVGFSANLDSSEAASSHGDGESITTTQAERAAIYQTQMTQLATAKNTVYNDYPVVGFYWWDYIDEDSEGLNWGMLSVYDNPYDGSASDASWSTSTTWQAGHSYTAPALIYDGANFEAMTASAFVAGSCISGSSKPAWSSVVGSTTTDNTCLWINEGPYLGEADLPPSSATIPNVAYGDFVTGVAAANMGIYSQIAPP